jgi:hypothetical protein
MKIFSLSAKILFLLLLLLNLSDVVKCRGKQDDIYEDIVLEIPPVKITRYEYEKNLNEFVNSYKNTNEKDPSEEDLKLWRKDFLDRMYLLVDLSNKGYDKHQDIIDVVKSMERIILTQDYGLVYDEFVAKKVNVSEEAVRAAYDRSGKHIKVEYLKFPSNEYLNSLVSSFKTNSKIETKKDFTILTAISKENPQIKNDTVEFVWPYFGMENIAEKIYTLQKDEIIPPTEMMDGIYVYSAIDVYQADKRPYEKIRPMIRMILEENRKSALRKAFYSKVDNAVSSRVDEVVCYKFMKKYDIELFKDINESRRTKNLNMQFKDVLKDTMLVYSFNSVKSFLTVEDFLQHYSHSAMLPTFSNQSDVSNYLTKYAQEEYLLQLADSLEIKKGIKHQIDKKNYKNKTILSFYEARELMPAIQVSDDEIEKYYRGHQQEYLSGDTAEITAYTFDTERNAFMGRMNLPRGMKNTPQENEGKPQYEGLKKLDSNVTVTRNNGKYSNEIARVIFNLKDDQYSRPIKLSSDFIVIKKIKESGSTVKPIEEVRDDIIQGIKEMKCDKIKKEKVLIAKKKYRIKVDKLVLE